MDKLEYAFNNLKKCTKCGKLMNPLQVILSSGPNYDNKELLCGDCIEKLHHKVIGEEY